MYKLYIYIYVYIYRAVDAGWCSSSSSTISSGREGACLRTELYEASCIMSHNSLFYGGGFFLFASKCYVGGSVQIRGTMKIYKYIYIYIYAHMYIDIYIYIYVYIFI
jgi:hypothetical protein